MRVTVVIPCHNEEGNLPPLTQALREVAEAQKLPFEIILTDDASTDRTWELLQELAGRLPQLDLTAGYTRQSHVPEFSVVLPGT